MPARLAWPLLWSALWLALVLASHHARPLMPVDETRYAGVAWEMWQGGEFLVPRHNGAPYSHKPPLLFWIIHLAWLVTGVAEWSARLVPALFALGNLFLTAALARRLWPGDRDIPLVGPLVLLASLYWAVFSTTLMFDMLMAFFTLLGLLGLATAWREGTRRGWLLLGLAMGLGVLTKGPVILIYTLPAALLAPVWMVESRPPRWGPWYRGILGALGVATLVTLAWALPAAWHGGEAYREAIFWGQTAGRMVESFDHGRPWWWYLPLLPVLLFPWLLWPPLWRGLVRGGLDASERLCLTWSLVALVVFSAISGKQAHYLLPVFPAVALLAARVLERANNAPRSWDPWLPATPVILFGAVTVVVPLLPGQLGLPGWVAHLSLLPGLVLIALGAGGARWLQRSRGGHARLALLSLAVVIVLDLGVVHEAAPYYDLDPAARHVAAAQDAGLPVAHAGRYHNQLRFPGRLTRPVTEIEAEQILEWAAGNPGGRVIMDVKRLDAHQRARAEHVQPYRGKTLVIWDARTLLEEPGLLGPAPDRS